MIKGLLLETKLPESTEYPEGLKGSYWTSSDLQFFVAAWNTNLVKKEEEPKSFEDFAHARWKNRLIAEPRDLEILITLTQKFKSQEKAVEVLRKVAANNVEFHSGHSQLAELLVADQAATCFSCYSHFFPGRIRKCSPLG